MPGTSLPSLAQLALENGLLTQEQLAEASKEAQGEQALERALISRGYLSQEALSALRTACRRLVVEAHRKEPQHIGSYEIISKIGEGGLGVVYKARQLSMGRLVALKVLHAKWAKDEEFRKRFLLEARIVGRLSHQNLIQVYDVGRDRGTLFFSMEYVDGTTVEKSIDKDGPLPLDRSLDIATQVLRAITYIWRHGIVHRDIKPGNIMLTRAGVAKLGDFGFVKSHFDPLLADDGEVLGTPDYISPEQALGREEIDFRSDIYSLGASLYHMLAGRAPFGGSSSSVMRKHLREEPDDIKTLQPNLPDAAAFIVRKMMAKDPAERYQSTQELFEDLEMVKIGQEPLSQRDNVGHSTIIRAMRLERSRLDRALGDRERLEKAVQTMKVVTCASLVLNAVLGIILIIILLFRG